MAKRLKTTPINFYTSAEIKMAAERLAEDDQRSLTGLIEKLIVDAAKAAGHWPPPAAPKAVKRKAKP
jgi:hypothetical protein